jgi:sugar-specific transcriptional regulator TrmB
MKKRFYAYVCSATTVKYEKLKTTNAVSLYTEVFRGELVESQFSKHQVLIDLGLTLTQARVYLALVESGPLKIATISKAANVARPDVYSTLSKLHQLGLVEKIIKKPLTYNAVPMREGLSLLLEAKTSQYEKVRAETRLLLELAKKKAEK